MDKNNLEHIIGKIMTTTPLPGGAIACSELVTTESGKKFVVKSGVGSNAFIKEANGLKELQKCKALRIPHVIQVNESYLVLEYIEAGDIGAQFFGNFGRSFAKLHQIESDYFGFYEDNFIGNTIQENFADGKLILDWTEFYWSKRLLPQIRLLEKNSILDSSLKVLASRLEKRFPSIIGGLSESPRLLHGDLWSGNFLVDEFGNPVLIDPAVYYDNREADIAMTKLFGGFSESFYEGYQAEFPLEEGWDYRQNIYKLYHVFNHLNMFGMRYYSQAAALMKYYL